MFKFVLNTGLAAGLVLAFSGFAAQAATCASFGSSADYATFDSCTASGNDKFSDVSSLVDTLFDGAISLTSAGSFAPQNGGNGSEFNSSSDLNPGRDGFKTTQTSLTGNTSFEFLSLPTGTIFVSLKQGNAFQLFGLFGKTVPFTLSHILGGDDTSHISTFAGTGTPPDPSLPPVPLPAAGLLLLTALGGLALRRTL